jgi:tRNA pseudouridine13 synthase
LSQDLDCFISPQRLAHAGPSPAVTGTIKRQAEDFRVEEVLGYEPDGAGSHAWLKIRKRNANTEWVARRIANFAGVRPGDVGFAGLKDRVAVTSQWFSVDLSGRVDPDWSPFNSNELEILEVVRHSRKLRRRAFRANHFTLIVRDLHGDVASVERRLQQSAVKGVPNYFGQQRFGRNADNIVKAHEMIRGKYRERNRHRRGLYLSATRALLFNRVVSHRVTTGTWDSALSGDVMMLDGSRSIFVLEKPDDAIRRRVRELDIHPTGPMWGAGELAVKGPARALEEEAMKSCETWCGWLEKMGLKQERRSLRLKLTDLRWTLGFNEQLRLSFRLPPGGYATSVLRELVSVN